MTTVLDQEGARRIALGLFARMGVEESITEEEHQVFLASLVGRDGDD